MSFAGSCSNVARGRSTSTSQSFNVRPPLTALEAAFHGVVPDEFGVDTAQFLRLPSDVVVRPAPVSAIAAVLVFTVTFDPDRRERDDPRVPKRRLEARAE